MADRQIRLAIMAVVDEIESGDLSELRAAVEKLTVFELWDLAAAFRRVFASVEASDG